MTLRFAAASNPIDVLAEAALPSTGFGLALLKMVLALAVVCLLAYLLLRLARRHLTGAAADNQLMKVVERCPLGPRQSLWVVEVCGRYLLIGLTDGGFSRLAELDRDEVQRVLSEQPSRSTRFSELLGRRKKGGDS